MYLTAYGDVCSSSFAISSCAGDERRRGRAATGGPVVRIYDVVHRSKQEVGRVVSTVTVRLEIHVKVRNKRLLGGLWRFRSSSCAQLGRTL